MSDDTLSSRPPELAHADDDELLRVAVLAARLAEVRGQGGVMEPQRTAERRLRERGHGRADFVEVGAGRQIARKRMEEELPPQPAQRIRERARLARIDDGMEGRLSGCPVERRIERGHEEITRRAAARRVPSTAYLLIGDGSV
jgi:hypothetical protein